MVLSDHKGQCIARTVLIYALSISTTLAMSQVHFANPLGAKGWRVSRNPLRCGLALTIPNYGIGYFEQYAAKQPHFILRQWDEVRHPLPARIIIKAPNWNPERPPVMAGRLMVRPGEYGLFLRRDSTLK